MASWGSISLISFARLNVCNGTFPCDMLNPSPSYIGAVLVQSGVWPNDDRGRVQAGTTVCACLQRRRVNDRLCFLRAVLSIDGPTMSDASLDAFLSRLSTQEAQPNPKSIAAALATFAKREDGPQLLRSNLQNGTDPLQAIPPAVMTLPYLYVLFVFFKALSPTILNS